MPLVSLPNTTCLPSKCGAGACGALARVRSQTGGMQAEIELMLYDLVVWNALLRETQVLALPVSVNIRRKQVRSGQHG